MFDLFDLDWATVLVFVGSLVLVTGLTLGVAAFGAKEKTFEEALEEQRIKREKEKGKKGKNKESNAKEAKTKFKKKKAGNAEKVGNLKDSS